MISVPGFIRGPVGKYFLSKDALKTRRNKKFINLKDASSLAIVYYLKKDEDYTAVSDFVESLKKRGLRVKALGYVKDRHLTQKYLPKLTYDYFYDKDLNWFGKPGGNYVRDFLDKPFDVLVDLSSGETVPINFVTANSSARFKVGRFKQENQVLFDLMIKQDYNDLKSFIKEVEHYLNIINNQ